MTIDEWIEKAKLNAKVNAEYPTDKMLLQEAEEYAQLADWLEELKDHRERECNHINEALYDKCYSEGYNKAIDDFVKMAKELKHEDGELSDIDLDYIAGFLRKESEEHGKNI